MGSSEEWKEMRAEIRGCRKCTGLNIKGISQSCPGFGDVNSPIVLVGQSLCRDCMRTQIPFTGGSGKILDVAIENSNVGEKDRLFITNLVHCHPPQNRPSSAKEKDACHPYLVREIELIQPQLVVTLGADAAQCFLGRIRITEIANVVYSNGNFQLIPMLHPAYIMRQRDDIVTDAYIRKLIAIFNEYFPE